MQSLAVNLSYLGGNGVLAVACEAIHAGAQQKVRASILRVTEEFVAIAFAPMCTHRAGSPNRFVDCRRFSSQRMLSYSLIGTRVGLILFFSVFTPLNFLRDQNLIAVSPSGKPSAVTARLECIRMPHAV